ncbi:MAG: Wzz/FepE/Etk N-terminal domain-containing protein [Clostridia bacterium]|nr:Wzz/FepE/Etk N-terminal domain-containing protein [Clostridia bacterium]
MEEIELNDILNIFRGKIFFIIILTLVITTIGSVYVTFFQKPLYMAETTMVLTAPVSANSNGQSTQAITQNDILLNQKLVSTYGEIIKSKKISSKVIENLKLNYTPQQINSMVTVSFKKNTEMLQINVLSDDPQNSANIANNVAEVFGKEIVSIYNIKNVSIIDKAEVNNSPYGFNVIKDIIMFFTIGFVLSIILSFVIYFFDTTVKNPEEVELKTGLPLLAIIPIYKK